MMREYSSESVKGSGFWIIPRDNSHN